MTLIQYTLNSNYPTISGATVAYGASRQTFNIGAALTAGSGVFTVDDTAVDPDLVAELDRHPALRRTGASNPPPAINPNLVSGGLMVAAFNRPTTAIPGSVWVPLDSSGNPLATDAWQIYLNGQWRSLQLQSGPQEIARNTITSLLPTVTTTANADTDFPGITGGWAITCNIAVVRPVVVNCFVPNVIHAVTNARMQARLYMDGTLVQIGVVFAGVSNSGGNLALQYIHDPSIGSHTYTIKFNSTGGGLMTFGTGALSPAQLQVAYT